MKFSSEDKEKIRKAVLAAEKKTSGEIVPVIVAMSDEYGVAFLRSLVIWGLICAICCQFIEMHLLGTYIGALFLGGSLCYFKGYRRLLISKKEMETEFTQRAYEAFLMNGVTQTKERNGVMLFISDFERRAMIVSDTGIQKELNNSVWEKMIGELTGFMKRGEYTEGIIKTVESIGNVLSEKFPDHKDDEDELANKLIIEV